MESPAAPKPESVKLSKNQTLEDILAELGPITSIEFEPVEIESPWPTRGLLPSSFPAYPQPFDYFTLFFTPDRLQMITRNTDL